MTCDKYTGFMPLKSAILLWFDKNSKKNKWKIMYRPSRDDYNPTSTYFKTDFDKFRSRSSYLLKSYGSSNSGWKDQSPFESFIQLIGIFFSSNEIKDDKFNIDRYELADFLYELGKIREFGFVRKMRYKLFFDDNFYCFEEYEKEIWPYEYCHPVLH